MVVVTSKAISPTRKGTRGKLRLRAILARRDLWSYQSSAGNGSFSLSPPTGSLGFTYGGSHWESGGQSASASSSAHYVLGGAPSGSWTWQQTSGTGTSSNHVWQSSSQTGNYSHTVNGVTLYGDFNEQGSLDDSSNFTTGGTVENLPSPSGGGAGGGGSAWVPSGTGAERVVASATGSYEGNGSATGSLPVNSSVAWLSVGTQTEDDYADSNSDHTTALSLLPSPVLGRGAGGEGSAANSPGSSAAGEYSWQATGGSGTTSGEDMLTSGYNGGGNYTAAGSYTDPVSSSVSYAGVDGTFNQEQESTDLWTFNTTDVFLPSPVLGRGAGGEGSGSGSGWQSTAGYGETYVYGDSSFTYIGAGNAGESNTGGSSWASNENLSQSGSGSEGFSYNKYYALGASGWTDDGGDGGAAGSGWTSASYAGSPLASSSASGLGYSGFDAQSGSNNTSYTFSTTAVFSNGDWSEGGTKTQSGSGTATDSFSGSGVSEGTSNSSSYNYTENDALDANGTWLADSGTGTLSASASLLGLVPWDDSSPTTTLASDSYTQSFNYLPDGNWETASDGLTATNADGTGFPLGYYSATAPTSTDLQTTSLVSLAGTPGAVAAVFGMTLDAAAAPEGAIGEGNVPGSTVAYAAYEMKGADGQFGRNNVSPVLPIGFSQIIVNYGLTGVGPGNPKVASAVTNSAWDVTDGPGPWIAGKGDGLIEPVCFARGTPVLMADGTTKAIERIERGEKVRAALHNDPEGAISVGEVVEIYHHEPRNLVEVVVGGQMIRCTPKHPFYVPGRGWTAAADLRSGDSLRTESGGLIAVDSVRRNGRVEPVFNIQVATLHTYFVRNGSGKADVLVHNDSGVLTTTTSHDSPVETVGEEFHKARATAYTAKSKIQNILIEINNKIAAAKVGETIDLSEDIKELERISKIYVKSVNQTHYSNSLLLNEHYAEELARNFPDMFDGFQVTRAAGPGAIDESWHATEREGNAFYREANDLQNLEGGLQTTETVINGIGLVAGGFGIVNGIRQGAATCVVKSVSIAAGTYAAIFVGDKALTYFGASEQTVANVNFAANLALLLILHNSACFVAGTPVWVGKVKVEAPPASENDQSREQSVGHDRLLAGTALLVGIAGLGNERRKSKSKRRKTEIQPWLDDGPDSDEDPAREDLTDDYSGEEDFGNRMRQLRLARGSACGVETSQRIGRSPVAVDSLLEEPAGGNKLDECPAVARMSRCGALSLRRKVAGSFRRSEPATQFTSRMRVAFVAACLLIAAFFGGRSLLSGSGNKTSEHHASAPAASQRTQAIETIRVGQRVLAHNPDSVRAEFAGRTAVNPATWRRLSLRAVVAGPSGDEDRVNADTLQPPEWVEANHARLGAMVPLPVDLAEMGLPRDLRAEVVANDPCPAIQGGEGQVVLTTVSHMSHCVGRLTVEDEHGAQETLRPTASHKFYREPDAKWVPLAALRPGDWLRGANGVLRVVAVSAERGVDRVYNMTVEGEHVYYVSSLGLLAHNNCEIVKGETTVVPEEPVGPATEPPNPVGEPTVEPPADGPTNGVRSAGKRYSRDMGARREALLRDAEDPNSGLTQEQREFIRQNDGNRVPEGLEVSHEEPLYTRPVEERGDLDVSDNMNTQPKPEHRARHRVGGDQYEKYGPPSDYPWNRKK